MLSVLYISCLLIQCSLTLCWLLLHARTTNRLKKDLKEIQGMKELRLAVELTDNPASVILNFDVGDDDSIPSSFLVEVPRYYPHSRPVVTCLQEKFRSTRYIGSSREVLHTTLCEKGWSAIGSLSTVIDILFQIIATYYHDYGPNESVVTAAGAMDTDEEHLFP